MQPDGTVSLVEFDAQDAGHRTRFAALNREWLTRYFHVEPEDEAVFADPQGKVLAKGGIIIFAQAPEGIIGTGALLRLPDNSFEVAKMAVTHHFQGRGAGTLILTNLIERARARGAAKLFIVSNTALTPALALYRKHGFRDSRENRHSHYERGDITLELALA